MAYTHYNSDLSEDNDNDTTDFVIIVVDLLTPHTMYDNCFMRQQNCHHYCKQWNRILNDVYELAIALGNELESEPEHRVNLKQPQRCQE